ncbi:UDP-glycosyltransferase 89B2 [Iris pallida]|uniref:UDP-glycosyltransferase 89B2 n=1 Tax=Iris pallida TaxID=29817 RepID=A0AAX6IM43_IRIPA|nr:UDP-glycosyltransferase 89B2 [Iris pallida]
MEKSEGGGRRRRKPHVLIIPFPAQGHLLPLLDLARHLSTVDALTITVAATPKNLPLLSPLLSTCPSVQPLLLPFPSHPSLPPGVENTKDLPPSLRSFRLFMANFANLRSPLLHWATSPSLAHPPTSIISDFFLGWTNGLAKELGVPRLTFSPSAAFTLSIARETWATMLRPPPGAAEDEAAAYVMSFPTLPGSPSFPWREMSPLYRAHEEGEAVSEAVRNGFVANMESWGSGVQHVPRAGRGVRRSPEGAARAREGVGGRAGERAGGRLLGGPGRG